MLNKSFYPTPEKLIKRMISKVKGEPEKVLEPSAGKGDIIDVLLKDIYNKRYSSRTVSAIEIDEDLQATLRGKRINVIDTDFLNYSAPDKYDLIIANPPFDEGDKHLLKAIDIMYRGEIIFLLNAETLKNPFTNIRKELVKKLLELNAEIEYIQNAFVDAERPTGVEIALVYINIERQIEDDLFAGADDKAEPEKPIIEDKHELSTGKTISELVAEYNHIIEIGQDTILNYYRNYKKIGKYIGLNQEAKKYGFDSANMTSLMQNTLNDMLQKVRIDFWRRTLDLDAVRSRLTENKQNEFEHTINDRSNMDFTESNIRQFILNLIGGYEQTLTDAVLQIFDKFTIRHSYSNGLYDDNIHYFNGWKTNNAFKVGKKVIIPIYGGYGNGAFTDYNGKWKLGYDVARNLRDIDVVMNYFDGMSGYISIAEALENAFRHGQSSKIVSTYFTITVYKKGTIHLTFNSDDILRRFNIMACKGKKWLPDDYGNRAYNEYPEEAKEVIKSFEGEESYSQNLNLPIFAAKNTLSNTLQLEAGVV